MFANGSAVGRLNVTPQHAIGPGWAWKVAGLLVFWVILFIMVLPASALASPIGPSGVAAIPGAPMPGIASHPTAISVPSTVATSLPSTLLGSNPALDTPSDGPAIAVQNLESFEDRGASIVPASEHLTVPGAAFVPSGVKAPSTSSASSAPAPLSPTPSSGTALIVGNVTGTVVSSVTGLPLEGVSVEVYSVGSAICSIKVCAQVATNFSGGYMAIGPAGADYVQFSLNWNLTNETYVTVYPGFTTQAGVTQLVPDGLAWGIVQANTTAKAAIDGVNVCATSRDDAVTAQPCEDTVSNGSFVVPLPPFPSIVTFTPTANYLSDFRFANSTPHRAGEPLLDLGTVYLTREVLVQVELYDAVTGSVVPSGVCSPYGGGTCRAVSVCSSITSVCQTQGTSVGGSTVTAMGVPGPSYVVAYAVGYITNTVNIGNVSKLQPGHTFDAGKVVMVPLGAGQVKVAITTNKTSTSGMWGSGLWYVTVSSLNGFVMGTVITSVFGGVNMTSTGSNIGGCVGVGGTGSFSMFPGRNDIVLSPDSTPTCAPPTPTWPIPGDFPVWGNETWANGTPDETVNIGWLNLTAGSYIYGHVYTEGQTYAPRNYTVIAESTESADYTAYPFSWNWVYQYGNTWKEETNGWGCTEAQTNTSFCAPAPPGDSVLQVSSNNMPTNQTWTFTHNLCCAGPSEKAGIPLSVATLEHIQSLNLTPQGSVRGYVFRNGTNLGVSFGVVEVCSALSDSVTPGVSCFDGVVNTNGSFSTPAPLGWDFITGSASGFEPNTVWAYVGGNHVFVGNISLSPVATLQGYVDGPNGGLLEAQVKTCLLSGSGACNLLGIGTTETDGLYNGTILGGWLPWSTYEVQASASGYSTDWTFVNATPGQATNVPTIQLSAVGSTVGTGSAAALSGVWVYGTIIDNSSGFGVQTTQIEASSVTDTANVVPFVSGSNSLGQFNESLLPGIYNLTISAAGYSPVTVEFNITGVPTYNFGTIQLVPFPFVNGTSWIAPWDNISVLRSGDTYKVIQLGAPAQAIACNSDQSVCGVGLPVSSQGTFFVTTPAGRYDILSIDPSATASSTSASGGVVQNNSIYNTTGWVTTLNVTVPLNVFAAIFSIVMDNSSVNPATGVAGWLPVHYNPTTISSFGAAHATVSWDSNGGGWDIWFIPGGVNKTTVTSSNGMYTVGNSTLNASIWPGGFYATNTIGVQHMGFINFQLIDSVTGLPIQYAGASTFFYDKANNTVYTASEITNGAGLVNVTSMYGMGVYVHVGADQDYNSSTFYTQVNESATSFSPSGPTNGTLGTVALDHWGYVASVQLNNSTGSLIPTVIDQAKGAPVPGVAISVTSSDSGTYGAGSSQDTSYAGQFFSDAPIGKADTLQTTRYGYLSNTTTVAITPDLYVAKPSINVTGAGVVAGLVVGLPSGTPISGAAISLCTAKGACYETVTNQSGIFWVLAAPGIDSVTATADGYVTNSSVQAKSTSDQWTWMGTITLSQFAYVYGLIRGLPSGLPINAADAALCSPLGVPAGACGFTNITGTSGQFLLTAPAGTYVLETSATNYNATYRPIALSPGQHVSVGTVFLEQFGTLQGYVYSSTTLAAVEGAQVYACAQWGGGSCTPPQATGSTGSFVLRAAPGPYILTVSAAGYADGYVPANIATGGVSSLLPILLIPLGTDVSYTVAGLVVNASNPSQGVSGAIVSLSLGAALAVSTQTNGGGAFSLSVIYGTYTMTVAAAGYHPLVRPITVNAPVTDLELTLAVMVYQVTGYAVDGLNGEALGGVSFSEISGPVSTLLGTSASDGSFDLALANGTHLIVADYSGLNSYTPLTFSVVIDGASQVHDVSLVPSNEQVYGIVADTITGLAIPNAVVTIRGQATDGFPITETATTDASGAFTAQLPAGSYAATTTAAGYYPVTFNFVVAASGLQLQFHLVPQGTSAGAVGSSAGGGAGLAPMVLGLVGVAAIAILAGAFLYRAAQPTIGGPVLRTRPTPVGARGTR